MAYVASDTFGSDVDSDELYVMLDARKIGLLQANPAGRSDMDLVGPHEFEPALHSIEEHRILGATQSLISSWTGALARDPATSAPVADPIMFPNDVEDLADKIHAIGLKVRSLGYIAMREGKPQFIRATTFIRAHDLFYKFTCSGRFGSLDFEEIDAKTYASWGVDYLKYTTAITRAGAEPPTSSTTITCPDSQALNTTRRLILYSMCNWGEDGPRSFATGGCPGILRTCVYCKLPGFHCAMTRIIDFAAPVGQKAGPGRWNDFDMLEIGNEGMNFDEYVLQLLWASVQSPPTWHSLDERDPSIIANDAIIAVNQDSAGALANRIWKRAVAADGGLSLWRESLANLYSFDCIVPLILFVYSEFVIALLNEP
ncbi:glycoside hydrolase family 27 protein [Ramaria rubella]|nr:glycoside hydrolase family 27 protein [Ramaria rubella]